MQTLAQNTTGITVPNSGHWIPEERPDFVINSLNNFFGSNSIKTPEMRNILKKLPLGLINRYQKPG